MTSSDFIILRSKDRSSGDSEDITLTLDESVKGTYEVKFMSLVNSLYNVIESENDRVYIYEGGATQVTATLTPGYYTTSTLATEVATRLSSASAGEDYTCTYSSTTGKFTIAAVGVTTFIFNFGTNTTRRANVLLGFNAADQSVAATSQVSDNVADLATHKMIAVKIEEDANRHVTLPGGTEVSFILPISDSSFGSLFNYKSNSQIGQYVKFNSQFNVLNISLYADDGDLIDLNGIDYILGLKKII